MLFALAFCAVAQAPPALDRRPVDRPELPQFLPEKPQLEFTLPPAPVAPERRLSGLRLTVRAFRFEGVTAFPLKDLEALVAPYTGRPVGAAELEEARLAITRRYIAAGYVNSGALIPDQEIRDGTVLVRVIEGRLARIEVGGENGYRPWYFEERMQRAAGTPLNVLALQERMQIFLQNPQIERIDAQLGAGDKPGDAVLKMDVTEAKKWMLGLQFANDRSPAIGGNRLEVSGAAKNLAGLGEIAGLRLSGGRGFDEVLATLAVPVSARDTLLTLKYEGIESRVIEPPFDVLAIENRSETVEVALIEPLVRTLTREIAAGATLVRRRNASLLLGQPFSFVPGLADGKSVVSVLRASGDWAERSAQQVLAARFTWSYGLDAFNSTTNNTGDPDSRFNAWLAQAQWVRRLGRGAGTLVTRADWQYADQALLPSEKFALGGMATVRGYRENALVRDNGWAASLEYRLEVLRWSPLGAPDSAAGGLEVALFGDAGGARDHGGENRKLSSLGAGLRWQPWRNTQVQVYKGWAGNNLQTPTVTTQDRGWHFLVQGRVEF